MTKNTGNSRITSEIIFVKLWHMHRSIYIVWIHSNFQQKSSIAQLVECWATIARVQSLIPGPGGNFFPIFLSSLKFYIIYLITRMISSLGHYPIVIRGGFLCVHISEILPHCMLSRCKICYSDEMRLHLVKRNCSVV